MNQDTAQIFWGRYQANSLHTFNNSLNYDDKIKEFIMNTSPFYSHQYIVPNDEIERFKLKFDQINLENFSNPDIIIINKPKLMNRATLVYLVCELCLLLCDNPHGCRCHLLVDNR